MDSPGGQRDIRSLVQEYYESLYRYAYRLSGSPADAADLTQETFLKAQEQLDNLREPSRARNWLFTILRNNFLHRLRSQKPNKHVSLDAIGDLEASSDDVPSGPETACDLQTALNELGEDWRTPIVLFYFEGFSYRDIADQMDLPIGTVMSRLARAKAYLRKRLRPEDSPDGAT